MLLGLEDCWRSSRWHVDRFAIDDRDTTERQRHDKCVPAVEDLSPTRAVGHWQNRSPRRLCYGHDAWLNSIAWPTRSIRRKGRMIPAVDFPHDFHQALSTSPAARTTCHMHAKALQHLADELAIFAMADQDRQPLALVAMQKIQRPSMPNSQ